MQEIAQYPENRGKDDGKSQMCVTGTISTQNSFRFACSP